MTIRNFAPRPMKLSVLTAAFQELTPRDRRDADPDLAIEEWLDFARDIGSLARGTKLETPVGIMDVVLPTLAGKVAQGHFAWDKYALLQQLGAIPMSSSAGAQVS